MKGYKAFNKDMTCRGFQFEEGQTYETDKAVICETGFHFCENPLDTLNYYSLCESEFAKVEALGETQTSDSDSKVCTTKIKIGTKLGLTGFIKASVDFLLKKYKKEGWKNIMILAASENSSKLATSGNHSQLAASGDFSQLATSGGSSKLVASGDSSRLAASGYASRLAASGYYSQLAASGESSQLVASGGYSQLAASGDHSQLATSGHSNRLATSGDYNRLMASGNCSRLATLGYFSKIEITGSNSVGAAIGVNNIIKAPLGCWITLAEYRWDGKNLVPACVKSVQVDGEIIKANTWYNLVNGEFMECN